MGWFFTFYFISSSSAFDSIHVVVGMDVAEVAQRLDKESISPTLFTSESECAGVAPHGPCGCAPCVAMGGDVRAHRWQLADVLLPAVQGAPVPRAADACRRLSRAPE
jgi:hypothetical protein